MNSSCLCHPTGVPAYQAGPEAMPSLQQPKEHLGLFLCTAVYLHPLGNGTPEVSHLTGRVGGDRTLCFLIYMKILRSVQEGFTQNLSVSQTCFISHLGTVLLKRNFHSKGSYNQLFVLFL